MDDIEFELWKMAHCDLRLNRANLDTLEGLADKMLPPIMDVVVQRLMERLDLMEESEVTDPLSSSPFREALREKLINEIGGIVRNAAMEAQKTEKANRSEY